MLKSDYFFIKKQKKLVSYKINLLKDLKIYPVFYVSLLKQTNREILI